jgi:hypothetical protein
MKMFCPKCGKGEQTPDAYCRSCGEWLPDINKLSRGTRRRSFGGLTPEQNIRTTVFLSLMSACFAVFIAVTLYGVLSGIVNSKAIIAVAAAFSLCIAGWQISNVIVAFKLRRRIVRRREDHSQSEITLNTPSIIASLPEADTAQFVRSPASVTDNTTELLQPILLSQKGERNN